MTVYVDPLRSARRTARWRWGQSAHLYADTVPELIAFAEKSGLRDTWYQNHPCLAHFDVTAEKRAVAVLIGAVEQSTHEMVQFMRKR